MKAPAWASTPEEQAKTDKENFERDQLHKLVNDELRRYGLLLQRSVVPKNRTWRTKLNEHVLYGQLVRSGFSTREVLTTGSFRDCCIVAAKLLDELDAAQVPDTAAGSDQR